MEKLLPWLLIICSTALATVADVLLKSASKEFTWARVVGASILYLLTVPLWILSMKSMPLSVLLPLWVCTALILGEFAATLYLGETLTVRIVVGCTLAVIAAIILGQTSS